MKSMTWENVSSFLKNVRSALRELLCFAQLEASEAQSVDVPVCRGACVSVRQSAGMQGCRIVAMRWCFAREKSQLVNLTVNIRDSGAAWPPLQGLSLIHIWFVPAVSLVFASLPEAVLGG